MNQYQQENATGEQKNFLSKIKQNYSSKFSNLSLSSGIPNMSSHDHDGSTEDDTLVHNAFVKYFDSKGEAYPEWLGVKTPAQNTRTNHQNSSAYRNSEFKPVYANYNSEPQAQPMQQNQQYNQQNNQNQYKPTSNRTQQAQPQEFQEQQQEQMEPEPQRPAYTPRSSSRLQDMYNKSRQQSIPGSGYNTQPFPGGPARTNSSSTTGSRLRERMLNASPSMNGLNHARANSNSSAGSSNTKATWGKR